jgi:hypothetical protein
MAAKFTKGDSVHTTNTTAQKNPPKNVGGNTMKGMRGYIDAHARKDMGGAKGGKGVGPHREGPIGERGGSGVKGMAKAGNAPGMSTKNYKSASTDSAGSLQEPNDTGSHKVHTANRTHKMPGQKAPPTSSGSITGQRVGIDAAAHRAKNNIAAGIGRDSQAGHSGRMESLKGRAQTSWEGRRKSSMY